MTEVTQEVKKTRTRTAKAVEVQAEVLAVEPRATSKQVGDKAPKAKVVPVVTLFVDKATAAQLAVALDPVNQAHLSGKKLGAIVAAGDGNAARIYVAKGAAITDDWVCSTATINAEGAVVAAGKIGDRRRRIVKTPITALELPVVADADLKNGEAFINRASLSGKRLGAMVVNATDWMIYVAEGSGPTAKWTAQIAAQTQITPSTPAAVVVGKLGDKPKSRKSKGVAAMPVTVATVANLSAKGSDLNKTALSGKKYGAVVATTTTGKTSLHMAVGSTDTAVWVDVSKGTAVTPA